MPPANTPAGDSGPTRRGALRRAVLRGVAVWLGVRSAADMLVGAMS